MSTPETQVAPEYTLTGQVAVVTGAARGIGRAAALRLARAGADVVIVDRNLAGAAEFDEKLSAPSVKEEIEALGRKSAEFEVDLTDRAGVLSLVDEVRGSFGRIDHLVHIAGGQFADVHKSTPSLTSFEDWQSTIDVNLTGTLNTTQAVLPIMREQGSGSIITTTSSAGFIITKGGILAAYGAAKAGIIHLTRSIAVEMGPAGIRANCVSPGFIASSRITAQAEKRGLATEDDIQKLPLRRFGTPDDVAKAVEWLSSDMASYISGQVISVCGGYVTTPF
jgi:NAD(P)-dependent dehydrogenase (short-subunit alcohol dehydrogenase family)